MKSKKYTFIKTEPDEPEEIYKIKKVQKKAILIGLDDLNDKKLIADEKANEQIDEWLKK